MTAEEVITALTLSPHPEGGWYRETFRDHRAKPERGVATQIYYLLQAGERSHWHRIDAIEFWHFYIGSPLALHIAEHGGPFQTLLLGADLAAGQQPQAVVPAYAWQSAEPLGAYTLVGCTVTPAFTFEGFTLAPPDWQPRFR